MKVIKELLRGIGQSEFSRNQDQARAKINELQGYDTLRRIAAEFKEGDSSVVLVEHTYKLSPSIILAVHFGLASKEDVEKARQLPRGLQRHVETWWESSAVGIEAGPDRVMGVRFTNANFKGWNYLTHEKGYRAYLEQREARWRLENPSSSKVPADVNLSLEDLIRLGKNLATSVNDYRYGKGHRSIDQRLGAAPKNWKIIQ